MNNKYHFAPFPFLYVKKSLRNSNLMLSTSALRTR
jgi:hypothetical protein